VKTFKESVLTFQSAMREWSQDSSDAEQIPALQVRPVRLDWSAWVVAGLGVVALVILPLCTRVETRESAAVTVNDDAALMEEVAMHLSRPMPVSMERVIVLFPDPEETQ
jgi:hypothetical protein